MHSSRMHTVRCSVCLGGVCLGEWGGVCLGRCLARGMSAWGVSAQRGVCPGGVRLPSVNRRTDRCKNITFPQR